MALFNERENGQCKFDPISSLVCFRKRNGSGTVMMPTYLITFINTARNAQGDVHRRWRNIYANNASPTGLSAIRRDKIQAIYKTLRSNRCLRSYWHRLIRVVGFDSPLISVHPAMPSLRRRYGNTYLDALLWCVIRHKDWLRPIENWHGESDDPRTLFLSLFEHLFLNYPVPEFLVSAWFEGYSELTYEHQNWVLHLGRGGSLQKLELPVKLTHRAAHLYLQTPPQFTVRDGLRYAQILAMDGTPELAAKLVHVLPTPAEEEAFFAPLLPLLVRQQPADLEVLWDLIEYLKFEKMRADAQNETFSFEGRTVATLCRDAEEWGTCKDRGDISAIWRKQELSPVEREVESASGVKAKWTFEEIATGAELFEEGKQMRNCIYTYLNDCLKGKTSVWSLRCHRSDYKKPRRVMTVEIEPSKRSIVEVGVFANNDLKPETNGRHAFAVSLIKEWAEANKLMLDCKLETG